MEEGRYAFSSHVPTTVLKSAHAGRRENRAVAGGQHPQRQLLSSTVYNSAGGGAPSLLCASDEQDVGKSAAAALGKRVIHTKRVEDLEEV